MRIVTNFLIAALAAVTLNACQAEDPNRAGVSGKTVRSTGTADIGGPFTLVDTTGNTVTEADLLGKPHLVYFGFAFCPDVCPTAMQKLGAAQTLMGDAGDDVGYVLFSVDPERDTPEKLAEYVAFEPFPTGLRGFTGTVEQVEAAKAVYKVVAQKVSTDGDAVQAGSMDYTVDHSDIIYFMDAEGEFVDFFSARSTPQDIAVRVRQELMQSQK
ncbi:photosynthetic protein synthase I [Litorimonas cladophorae]|uniref:Photosynthetic protein synthase I n=1 Tax=Litorimonas cladophorae TaxID=1220491 RepID=A0A918KQ39_9PROT|nr:SCO family protein [Litorimonas cladophorae]GGX68939.1 photosynthetic protein synthase I [Litorimonas cladophorae]